MVRPMSTFAILHRRRGLIETMDGTAGDAMRAAADLTDRDVWLGAKIGTSDEVALVQIPQGAEFERYEVFVIPCVRFGKLYLMSVGGSGS